MDYAMGTGLIQRYPWGTYVGGRALCSDGKVRRLARIAPTADTFFSVPAAVKVAGRTVSGYVTIETMAGWTTETVGDPAVVKFVAYTAGKNGAVLPAGAYVGGGCPVAHTCRSRLGPTRGRDHGERHR